MDLPIKRIAIADVKINQDETIDIIDCSYKSKLVHLDPLVGNTDFAILVKRSDDVHQVYKFESDYYFENLNRPLLLSEITAKLAPHQIEVLDLGILYEGDDGWHLRDKSLILTWEPRRVTYALKAI